MYRAKKGSHRRWSECLRLPTNQKHQPRDKEEKGPDGECMSCSRKRSGSPRGRVIGSCDELRRLFYSVISQDRIEANCIRTLDLRQTVSSDKSNQSKGLTSASSVHVEAWLSGFSGLLGVLGCQTFSDY